MPPVVARPWRWVARSSSDQTTPPAARATRAAGSTDTAFISDRSIITPSSQTAWPATACPPPRTETGRSRSRAKRTACGDVVGARAARDQRRPAVDRAVPDPPGLVVALLAGPQQRAAEARRAGRRRQFA